MKNFFMTTTIAVAMVILLSTSGFAQTRFIQSSGVSNVQCVNGTCFIQQQSVIVPQSIGFFSSNRSNFVSKQFISERAVAVPVRRNVVIQRNRRSVNRTILNNRNRRIR